MVTARLLRSSSMAGKLIQEKEVSIKKVSSVKTAVKSKKASSVKTAVKSKEPPAPTPKAPPLERLRAATYATYTNANTAATAAPTPQAAAGLMAMALAVGPGIVPLPPTKANNAEKSTPEKVSSAKTAAKSKESPPDKVNTAVKSKELPPETVKTVEMIFPKGLGSAGALPPAAKAYKTSPPPPEESFLGLDKEIDPVKDVLFTNGGGKLQKFLKQNRYRMLLRETWKEYRTLTHKKKREFVVKRIIAPILLENGKFWLLEKGKKEAKVLSVHDPPFLKMIQEKIMNALRDQCKEEKKKAKQAESDKNITIGADSNEDDSEPEPVTSRSAPSPTQSSSNGILSSQNKKKAAGAPACKKKAEGISDSNKKRKTAPDVSSRNSRLSRKKFKRSEKSKRSAKTKANSLPKSLVASLKLKPISNESTVPKAAMVPPMLMATSTVEWPALRSVVAPPKLGVQHSLSSFTDLMGGDFEFPEDFGRTCHEHPGAMILKEQMEAETGVPMFTAEAAVPSKAPTTKTVEKKVPVNDDIVQLVKANAGPFEVSPTNSPAASCPSMATEEVQDVDMELIEPLPLGGDEEPRAQPQGIPPRTVSGDDKATGRGGLYDALKPPDLQNLQKQSSGGSTSRGGGTHQQSTLQGSGQNFSAVGLPNFFNMPGVGASAGALAMGQLPANFQPQYIQITTGQEVLNAGLPNKMEMQQHIQAMERDLMVNHKALMSGLRDQQKRIHKYWQLRLIYEKCCKAEKLATNNQVVDLATDDESSLEAATQDDEQASIVSATEDETEENEDGVDEDAETRSNDEDDDDTSDWSNPVDGLNYATI